MNKNYNSYLVLGVIVVVVIFLFVFGMLNGNKNDPNDPMADSGFVDGEFIMAEDEKEDTDKSDEVEPTIMTEQTDEEMLNVLLEDFNNAWITYVNDDAIDVFNYVGENSDIHFDIIDFDTYGLTEELLDMRIDEIQVEGDIAYIYNYEKFNKIKDGVENVVDYNWVYTAKKVDGKWLLDSFVYDTSN